MMVVVPVLRPTRSSALTAALLGIVGVFVAEQLWQLVPLAVGCDFIPLRHAAEALLDGASVYRDPSFVYPPTVALALLPTTVSTDAAAFAVWLAAIIAALTATAVTIARAAPLGGRLRLFAFTLMVLLGGTAAQGSLFAGNLSALLALVAVGILLAFHRGRWTLGCSVLAASLLIKPLLAPLILIPVLSRRWRPLVRTMLPAGAVLLLSLVLVPGGTQFPGVLRHSLTGSNLHGTEAVNNLSLHGWTEAHQISPAVGVLAAIAVVVATAIRIGTADVVPAWLGSVLLLMTFLAGRIAEANYLFIAASAAMLHLALRPPPGRWLWIAHLAGLGILALPTLPGGAATQTWLVGSELLTFAALLIFRPPAERPAPDLPQLSPAANP